MNWYAKLSDMYAEDSRLLAWAKTYDGVAVNHAYVASDSVFYALCLWSLDDTYFTAADGVTSLGRSILLRTLGDATYPLIHLATESYRDTLAKVRYTVEEHFNPQSVSDNRGQLTSLLIKMISLESVVSTSSVETYTMQAATPLIFMAFQSPRDVFTVFHTSVSAAITASALVSIGVTDVTGDNLSDDMRSKFAVACKESDRKMAAYLREKCPCVTCREPL